jgi:BlaI family transcriptional regulator, penicillinase repressor
VNHRNPPAPLSARQMEIMNVVWARGKVTVAEVWEIMAQRRKVARNTVQTIMTRLEDKGWLGHVEEGAAFRYFARRRRETTLKGLVAHLVENAFAGSTDSLVMALLESRGVSEEESRRILAIIEQAERGERAELVEEPEGAEA